VGPMRGSGRAAKKAGPSAGGVSTPGPWWRPMAAS